jgi:hypothetical protein
MCAIFSSLHSWLINGLGWEKGRRQAGCLAIVTGLCLNLCDNEDVGYVGFGMVMCVVGWERTGDELWGLRGLL